MRPSELKITRVNLGYNQAQMANKLNVSQSYYSQIERGEKPLSEKLKAKLKDRYDIDNASDTLTQTDFNMKVSGIKQARSLTKLSQTDFAKMVGVGRSYIAQIEGGKNKPSPNLINSIKKVFSIHVDFEFKPIPEALEVFKQQLTNDPNISDHDYRVMVQTVDRIKELLKGF